MIRLTQEDREMNNKYEAAEVVVVGDASNTILGIKDLDQLDNRVDSDMFHRDDVQLFEE
jgi:hypothetical protein